MIVVWEIMKQVLSMEMQEKELLVQSLGMQNKWVLQNKFFIISTIFIVNLKLYFFIVKYDSMNKQFKNKLKYKITENGFNKRYYYVYYYVTR
jgi:hypothetical protein